ncbi:hypothetical protein CsatA_012866 [Cannabis sativa]
MQRSKFLQKESITRQYKLNSLHCIIVVYNMKVLRSCISFSVETMMNAHNITLLNMTVVVVYDDF